jgi:prepilin-type N-terminal cleavage/methylation domain-containing protein
MKIGFQKTKSGTRGTRPSETMKIGFKQTKGGTRGTSPSETMAFTLVEVIVCTAVIAILFVSLYGGIASGFALVNLARENLRANQVILEKMETVRLYNWDQVNSNGYIPLTFTAPFFPSVITNMVGTNTDGSSKSVTVTNQGGGLVYYGTLTITNAPVSDAYKTNMKMVTVSLVWTNGRAVRNRQMQTFISQYGMQNYIYF